ncbi:Bacteriophytochrome cph2 [Piscirickettsia salmonis]|uniref:Diguanylate cyclase domain protein n=3 Tax=Piscirickettsia salmonis TaxID=1238 RepID=A0AAC8VGM9_PISSA|nr:EAL domain-containing protein [Piscirickettsia salmonis]AKP73310.2 hypothetical protein PSLF89_1369 [Piscirickettsia salmonis LF-89 = ATCC VR-1361]ALB22014.1 diguanylate cyclase domain protein [Piscirickettsia salmonis]ALY02158.1 hypothetical protein AWE47_04225 [Piscirickettsia salmonis]AMA41672.1 hypothetical protein AWJ11_04220 [Piscirickettsia salmonis]AOS34154.1 hypothetical protein AVM72_01455 [Piscirickettsia salmonis]
MQNFVIEVLFVGRSCADYDTILASLSNHNGTDTAVTSTVTLSVMYNITSTQSIKAALASLYHQEFDCLIMDDSVLDDSAISQCDHFTYFIDSLVKESQYLPPMVLLIKEGYIGKALVSQYQKIVTIDYLVKDLQGQYFNLLPFLMYQLIDKNKLKVENIRLQEKNNAILDAVADGIIGVDEKEMIYFINRMACKILGYSAVDELIGKKIDKILHDSQGRSLAELVKYVGQVGAFETEVTRKKGNILPIEMHCSLILEQVEKTIVISFRDITARKRHEAELVRLAQYDDLTKLANKSLFLELLGQAISRANRSKYYFALLFLDMDNFKSVNDNYGHAVGDKLLQEVAQRLKSCTRGHDIIARIGGDEFTIILEELRDEQDVFWVCEKIKTSLAYPFVIQGVEIEMAVSIGIVTFKDIYHTPEALLRYADMAMYAAKRQGTGHYEVFNQAMSDHTKELIHLRAGIAKAIENDELFVQFQPKVNTDTNYCQSVEALLRWKDSLYGIIKPAKFISLAEEIGIINELGLWILKQACVSCKKLEESTGQALKVSVNISMYQMKDDIADKVKETVLSSGINPENLELEITESHIMNNPAQAIAILLRLKKLGIKIAIDDFGTGYSSLSYLTQLPIDRLKIDSSFTQKIPADTQSVKVVQSIISLAKSLQLKITAEGVENKEQFDFLKKLNCDEVQGYLLSHPLSEKELIDFFNTSVHGMPTR